MQFVFFVYIFVLVISKFVAAISFYDKLDLCSRLFYFCS